jgi:hypothetical protein
MENSLHLALLIEVCLLISSPLRWTTCGCSTSRAAQPRCRDRTSKPFAPTYALAVRCPTRSHIASSGAQASSDAFDHDGSHRKVFRVFDVLQGISEARSRSFGRADRPNPYRSSIAPGDSSASRMSATSVGARFITASASARCRIAALCAFPGPLMPGSGRLVRNPRLPPMASLGLSPLFWPR